MSSFPGKILQESDVLLCEQLKGVSSFIKMAQDKFISIIMPAYNVEKFVAKTIESILAQTHTHWELIIIDDGSTDGTKTIIDTFLEKDQRIRYYYQENGRQGKARNKGLELAQSDIIAFMDADDILIPEMLQEQYALLIDHNADLAFSSVTCVNENMEDLQFPHGFPHKIVEGIDGAEQLLTLGNPIPIITVVARKNSVFEAGCFKVSSNIQYAEEYSLWLRMLLNGCKFIRNEKRVAFYIFHPQQSSRLAKNKHIQMLEMINDLPAPKGFELIKEKHLGIWIRRSLQKIDETEINILKRLSYYQPTKFGKIISILATSLLPSSMAKKVLYRMSYQTK
ncbi:MAG: glycosyltransferase family 2 protein [Bacteroidetes bacterium]|nr:glycosyltransferase family 2 protein [Bacteroidota bacterium]